MTIALRPALPSDGSALEHVFRDSIAVLTEDDYADAQRAAWASAADDSAAFGERLAKNLTLVAVRDGALSGFATLAGETIEMLYVHPDHARRGVATALIDALEKLAHARGVAALQVDASDTAQAFFGGRGYGAKQRNSLRIGGEWLASTTMKKQLSGAKN